MAVIPMPNECRNDLREGREAGRIFFVFIAFYFRNWILETCLPAHEIRRL